MCNLDYLLGTVVEHLTRQLKVQGLSLVTAAVHGREKNAKKFDILVLTSIREIAIS